MYIQMQCHLYTGYPIINPVPCQLYIEVSFRKRYFYYLTYAISKITLLFKVNTPRYLKRF